MANDDPTADAVIGVLTAALVERGSLMPAEVLFGVALPLDGVRT